MKVGRKGCDGRRCYRNREGGRDWVDEIGRWGGKAFSGMGKELGWGERGQMKGELARMDGEVEGVESK